MRGINGADCLSARAPQSAQALAEPIAAIADREEVHHVVRPRDAPAARDRFSGGNGGECAFEFVGRDEDGLRHALFMVFPQPMSNLNARTADCACSLSLSRTPTL